MNTKSLIQLTLENLQQKSSFKEGINNLMEKYNIEDSIFVLNENKIKEATDGYFSIINEYDNLDDAIKNCNINSMGIRVMENKNFQVGAIYYNLYDCPENTKILDIDKLTDVR